MPILLKNIQSWARLYKVKELENAEFESGSNFKCESALRLRSFMLNLAARQVCMCFWKLDLVAI